MRVDWYAISMLKPITAHEFPGPKGGIYIHRIAAIEPFYQVTIILFGVPCWVEKWLGCYMGTYSMQVLDGVWHEEAGRGRKVANRL